MAPVVTRLALVSGVLAVFLPFAARAALLDWETLADDPESYIGKPVEVIGYCAEDGDAGGYRCSTEGDLYIATPDIKPDFAKRKIEENCGGLDVVERSDFCRAKISFTPRSVSTAKDLEPDKTITVIATDIATLKF
ncbi:hypothetical protein [Methyloceanibacter sp.]|uniref:hypothetical protein n=1 Tax=Methyloceanibacter sp. TaxID=1965321 RepID=UPI002D238769|nr:hypothetical protein [Methyloceanibacter sp.]HZP08853.1 hypothetical protein [Methyloceanibacter sp.]